MLFTYQVAVESKLSWAGLAKRREIQNKLDDSISKKGGRALGATVRSGTVVNHYEFDKFEHFVKCTRYLMKRKNLKLISAKVQPE